MSAFNTERMQRSIATTARMLAGRNVEVTHRGGRAFVEWDANFNIRRINLPMIPANSPPPVLQALQGYLDHEIGHVLYTDVELYAEARTLAKNEGMSAKVADGLVNIIEDVRIEAAVQKELPGTRFNLDAVRKVVINDMVQKALDKSTDSKRRTSIAMMPYFRAKGGQECAIEFMNRNELWPLFDKFEKAMPDLADRLLKLKDSGGASLLAVELMKAIRDLEQPEDPEPEEDDEGDGDEGKGKPKDKKPKDKKPKDKKPKDKKPEGKKPEEGEGEEDEKGECGSAGEDEGEEEEDGAGGGEDEDEDKGEGAGEDGGEDEASGAGEDESEEGDGGEFTAGIESDALMDFDDAAAASIEGSIVGTKQRNEMRDYTRDFDRIETAPIVEGIDPSEIGDAVSETASALQKELQRLIVARSRSVRVPGHKSGRLHPASLHRVMVNDDRCFTRKYEGLTNDVAVSLVVDNSGSMANSGKDKLAMQAAWAFCEILSRLKISNEVIGFSTDHRKWRALVQDEALMKDYHRFVALIGHQARLEPIYMPVFKAFDENFGVAQRQRMASGVRTYATEAAMFKNNMDGQSLRYAGARLYPRREARKVMIVFSDGCPHAEIGQSTCSEDLKRAVAEIQAAKIEMVGIGIGDSSVEKYYTRNVVINKVRDLTEVTLTELRRILTPN